MSHMRYAIMHCCEEFKKYKFDNQPNTEGGSK